MTSPAPLATAFVVIRPTTTGFGPTLKRQLDGAAGVAGASGKKTGESWTKGFQSSGITKAAGKITEGIVGIGVVSVVAAAKFQSAMERLHTQAGVAQSKIKDLGDGILTLAGQVGFSPDSLATSLYHVESSFASLGITSKKALQVVKIAAEGAAVGGANLEDVTNALTAVMASGIKVTGGMAGAMGELNRIVGAGDMKMQDLADAFGTGLLASIKGFGVSITDAGAALAVFGDNNIRGAKAGTQLRMAIQALAAPTGSGKKILEGWGLTANRFAADLQKGGLRGALEDLQKLFVKFNVGAKQQGQYLTELFGKRAGVGIQILLGQMGRFESKFKDLTKGSANFGDAWKKTQATASQQFQDLTRGLEAVGVSIGEKLLPPVMAVFNFIRSHVSLVLTLAGIFGGLAVAITAVSLAIKLAVVAQELWTAAMWLFDAATSANPIGATVILIGILVTAIILLWKHSTIFRNAVLAVWDAIKIAFDAVWSALKTAFAWVVQHWKLLAAVIFGPIGLAVDLIVTHWKFVTKVFALFWSWIKTTWQQTYDYIIKPIGRAAAFIFNTWKTILTQTALLIIKIKNFFAPAISWLVKAGKDVISGLFGGMWNAVQAAASWVARIGGRILKAVTNFFGIKSPSTVFFKIGGHLMAGLFKGMVHGASGLAKWVIGQIKNLPKSIWDSFLSFLGFGGGSSGGGGGGGGGSPSGADARQSMALARTMFPWSGSQWPAFNSVEMREAGYNRFARNPGSGAYGIPQALPPTKMPFSAQAAGGSSATSQLNWMFDYIKGRYGTPSGAWAHEQNFGWYDRGGWLKPGWTMAYNGTGRPEQVIAHGASSGAGRVPHAVIEFRGSFWNLIKDHVRVAGGGDVQVTFGTDH